LPLQIAELQPLLIDLMLQRLQGLSLRCSHRPSLDRAKLLLLVMEAELQIAELLLIEPALRCAELRVLRRGQRLPLQRPELQLLLLEMKLKRMELRRRGSAGESAGGKEETKQEESDAAHMLYMAPPGRRRQLPASA
jgi:hypothetical protein